MGGELSDAEKMFIIHGVHDEFRNDGRRCEDFRPMVIETGAISNTSGSARIRMGNTDILVGVKAEIDTPLPERPDEGRIQFFVDCSANATPEFEGRGGEELAQTICTALSSAYTNEVAIGDLKKLCLVPSTYCWLLYVDVVLLECGGNLIDAASFAVKAALHNTRIPNVTVVYNAESEEADLELTDDHYDFWRLDVGQGAPVLVSVCKVGTSQLVDPGADEETCSKCSLVVGVAGCGDITLISQQGRGSLDPESLNEMVEVGVRVAKQVNSALMNKLNEEETLNRPSGKSFL